MATMRSYTSAAGLRWYVPVIHIQSIFENDDGVPSLLMDEGQAVALTGDYSTLITNFYNDRILLSISPIYQHIDYLTVAGRNWRVGVESILGMYEATDLSVTLLLTGYNVMVQGDYATLTAALYAKRNSMGLP